MHASMKGKNQKSFKKENFVFFAVPERNWRMMEEQKGDKIVLFISHS